MFPFDKVKIDKSFVKGLPTDSHAAAIIASITTLARGFDMAVTAEGIETSEQCELLRLSGINLLQGYFFAQPGPVGSLEFVTMEKSRKAV
jgi:EAL domain-containing protein (putative c-di-GMP-specific phosphodiesterase class I)